MPFKFKVGDKVRVTEAASISGYVGEEGIVTRLGGAVTPEEGAVVTNEKFSTGHPDYGEHGHWFYDEWLELVS